MNKKIKKKTNKLKRQQIKWNWQKEFLLINKK